MDPKHQDFDAPAGDVTLAETVVGLDKLRARFAANSTPQATGAWDEWRMLVDRAIRITDSHVKEVIQLRADYSKCARAELQTKLLGRVETLERAAERRRARWTGFFMWAAGIFAAVAATVIGAYALKHL